MGEMGFGSLTGNKQINTASLRGPVELELNLKGYFQTLHSRVRRQQ